MKHFLLSLLAVAALCSCETTGDPNQGGLFGWSQSKANDRIAVREEHLAHLERQNAYQQGKSDALEDQLAKKKAQSQY